METILLAFSMALVGLTLRAQFIKERETRVKMNSQKKSGEVLLGNISEVLAPFLKDFPIEEEEVKNLNFLGMPIDFVYFGEDEVKFIEVKSGNSRLSKKQTRIKKNIQEGRVKFEIFRVK